jgi:thiamine-phosphate pyrophosphorylase
MNHHIPKLTLVTHQQQAPDGDYLEFITQYMTSQLHAVQLRDKYREPNTLLYFSQQLHDRLKAFRIPLIVNDHLDLCLQLNADGLHLGQNDGDIHQARAVLGPDKLIGLSINNLDQLEQANHLPIDYVGIGSIFPTRNKADITTLWGLEGLAQAASISKHPIIAIGGINEQNAGNVIHAGADGIAAIDAFHQSLNPTQALNTLSQIIHRAHHA